MKLINFLCEEEKKGLRSLGVDERELERDSHIFYFVRKKVAKNLYAQLREKGLRMYDCLYIIAEILSLSPERVKDLIFRRR